MRPLRRLPFTARPRVTTRACAARLPDGKRTVPTTALWATVSLIGCGAVERQRRISVVSRRAGLLTAGQLESLERDGYLLVLSLLDETVLAPMRTRLDELVYQTLVAWDANPGQDVEERGVVHAKLGLPDPDFAPCREHPLLAEAAAVMLGPDWH